MRQEMKQAMVPLDDEQIAVSRATAVENGPRVTTQMRGGGHWNSCQTEGCCNNANGKWMGAGAGCWIPIDTGSGDWD